MISWKQVGLYMIAIGITTILNVMSNTTPSLSAASILLGSGLALVIANWRGDS